MLTIFINMTYWLMRTLKVGLEDLTVQTLLLFSLEGQDGKFLLAEGRKHAIKFASFSTG